MADAVLIRTTGSVTRALPSCYRGYISLLRQQLSDVAGLHVLTDLSLSLPPSLTASALRELADAHQHELSLQLDRIPVYAYTVADIVRAFPSVAWPIPGNLHPLTMLNNDTQIWLRALWARLEASGLRLSRTLDGRTVSNLLSYYVHEPSLCLWMRRQQLAGSIGPPRCGARAHPTIARHSESVPRRGVAGMSGWSRTTRSLWETCGKRSCPLATHRRIWWPSSSRTRTLTTRPGCTSTPHSAPRCPVTSRCTSAVSMSKWQSMRWSRFQPAFRLRHVASSARRWEHVERYSLALLLKLEDLLQRGAAAYGELFASTVCARMSWCASCEARGLGRGSAETLLRRCCGRCTKADLRETGIVAKDGQLFADTVTVSRKAASHLLRRTRRDGGRWVHAVKDGCLRLAIARCGARLRTEQHATMAGQSRVCSLGQRAAGN